MKTIIRASAREVGNAEDFFTAEMKRVVLNRNESIDGCFNAFFQTQHASFSGRCGGRSAVGGGNGTQKGDTCLCAQAAKQPHGHPIRAATKFSSAVASKSIHHGSRLQIFD